MYKKYFKRILDLAGAIVLLPIVLPVIAICGICVNIEDKGAILYKSSRAGKNGIPFTMYKIRSMKLNAPDLRNEDGSTFNSTCDPRVTKIGRLLRKTSLDELPQILNVIKGDMSFIGPRPDLSEQYCLYDLHNKDKKKFQIEPGITGLAQCSGRNDLTWDEKLVLDRHYVENISFFLDVKIIFKTVGAVLLSKGVNQSAK